MSLIIKDILFHEKPIERTKKCRGLILNANEKKKKIGTQFKLFESNGENCQPIYFSCIRINSLIFKLLLLNKQPQMISTKYLVWSEDAAAVNHRFICIPLFFR
jgi:hypothetical protein